ncbi:unnamed protein product, partial [Ixodes hexagonus]
LGVRSALKLDLGCTAAELVYGSTLRLPGEFFNSNKNSQTVPPQTYLDNLRELIRELQLTLPRLPDSQKVFISQEIQTCTHVFIRKEGSKKSLTPPYDGPFKVLKRTEKTMTLDVNGHTQTIAIDRLKPAF